MLSLGLMVKELPEKSIWSVGGIGDFQLKMNSMAIIAGGGVRIGLEDNIFFDSQRTILATNAQLVKRIVEIARTLEHVPYTHREARQLLGVS